MPSSRRECQKLSKNLHCEMDCCADSKRKIHASPFYVVGSWVKEVQSKKENSKGTQTRRFEQVEKSKPHTIGPKHF